MTDGAIDELYCMLIGNYHYYDGINPVGLKKKNDIDQKTDEKIEKAIGQEAFIDIEDVIGEKISSSEHYGFVTGFKYAMRLMLAGNET